MSLALRAGESEAVSGEPEGGLLPASSFGADVLPQTLPPGPVRLELPAPTLRLLPAHNSPEDDSKPRNAATRFLELLDADEPPPSLPGGELAGRVSESVRWEGVEPSERVLLRPIRGSVSLVGSATGGGVTADERFGSVHGWKTSPGLDAVPDHEAAAGLSMPVSTSGRLGVMYRTIQPEAQWATDRYWGGAAPPIRVEDDQNHGVVLFVRFRF